MLAFYHLSLNHYRTMSPAGRPMQVCDAKMVFAGGDDDTDEMINQIVKIDL